MKKESAESYDKRYLFYRQVFVLANVIAFGALVGYALAI